MKNPLKKRLPREFIGDFGKYLLIFLFMIGTIGFVSGFLVADDSMMKAYDESFEKYNSKKKRKNTYYRIYVKNYTIFYTIKDNAMEVRRILSSRRNFDKLI